jgi:hypothetical protein
MSGGSYSRSSLRGSGFNSEEWSIDECCKLTIQDSLVSPNMLFFKNKREKDTLFIGLDQGAVVVFDNNGKPVGSIFHAKVDQLKRCLQNQYNFEARIISIDAANIVILIRCTGEE